jgi:hypothetical protein
VRESRPLAAGVVLFGFVVLAVALTWPLPLHLQTHLLGSPTGDTGVYVWNLWIFRHEIVRHGHLPVSTDHVFAYTGGADFSLHNYMPVGGLLALPLIGPFGVVAAFNLVLIAFVASAGAGMYVLGRRLGLSRWAAWLGGAVFAASPVLTAKETAHISLVGAAPLPLFVWALLRTLETKRARDAALTGAMVAIATYADAYYGVYCLLMGAFVVAWRYLRVTASHRRATAGARVVDALGGAVVILLAWRLVVGPENFALGSIQIKLQTLYTPVLALVALVALRAWMTWRPRVRIEDPAGEIASLVRPGAMAVFTSLMLLLPSIVGIAYRALDDRLPETETFWRSSPAGVDALAYFVPNPSHAWFGDWTRPWFIPPRPEAFPEFVASFSLVALVVVAIAAWRGLLPRMWVAFTAAFGLLSLGPFIHVAGVNTYVVGPWAFLRYVPIVGMARSPSRFAVVTVMGASVLFAFAAQELWRRRPAASRAWAAVLGLLLVFELIPAPRQLYSAAVPEVYRLIAEKAPNGDESPRLLELPTGIRDGTSSIGDFNPAAPFYQTLHRRPMIGGYLSRISASRKRRDARDPILRALYRLSERRPLPEGTTIQQAREWRDRFLRRSCVRFVVLDKGRASPELRDFAVDVLQLTRVHEDDIYELFTPIDPPACDPRPRHRRLFRVSLP